MPLPHHVKKSFNEQMLHVFWTFNCTLYDFLRFALPIESAVELDHHILLNGYKTRETRMYYYNLSLNFIFLHNSHYIIRVNFIPT